MSDFLKDFLPIFALMMLPFAIPFVAVAVGALSDLLRGENRVESVEDRVRGRLATREVAEPVALHREVARRDVALDAA